MRHGSGWTRWKRKGGVSVKVESVRLRGFRGIKKGMHRDEIFIDLSGLSGLIALSGDNGFGKSTLIDNFQPFRIMPGKYPSKDPLPTYRESNLRSQVFLRDSLREQVLSWHGDKYETLIKIDAESNRGEAYVYKNGRPEIKGKLTEYDRYWREICGSEILFFASVFGGQKKKSITDLTPGKLRALFAEFLRQDVSMAQEKTLKQGVDILLSRSQALENERLYLEGEVSTKAGLRTRLTEKEALLLATGGLFENLKTKIFLRGEDLKALRARVEDSRIHETRLKALQAAGVKIKADWQKEKETAEKEINTLRAKQKEVEGGIVANNLILERRREIEAAVIQEKDMDAQLQDAQKRKAVCDSEVMAKKEAIKSLDVQAVPLVNEIAQREKIISRRQEIEAASETETMLNGTIQATDVEISANESHLRELMDDLNALVQQRGKLGVQIEGIRKDDQLRSLNNTVASLKEKKELLDKKDPACTSRTCAFIISALKAEELPAIEKALSDRIELLKGKEKALLEELSKVNETVQTKTGLRVNLQSNLKTLNEKATRDRARLLEVRAIAALKSSLDESLLKIDELRERKHNLDRQRTETFAKLDSLRAKAFSFVELIAHLETCLKPVLETAALKSSLDQATAKLEGLNKRKQDLEGDILTKQNDLFLSEGEFQTCLSENTQQVQQALQQVDPLAATDLEQAETDLKNLTTAKETTEKEIRTLRGDLAGLEAQIKALEEKERRLAEIQEKRTTTLREASKWEYLKNELPKLRIFEINSVEPMINYNANQLLASTFGPDATIKLSTLNDNGNDDIVIKVIDEDGDEVVLDDRSGGQQVWALKAIRLGMTMLSKERSGRDFKTIFADEEDGALSNEKAKSFIRLYRSLMKLGGFDDCFYISHKEAAVGLADHVLKFTGSGIEIE